MEESFVLVDGATKSGITESTIEDPGCKTEHTDGLAVLEETVDAISKPTLEEVSASEGNANAEDATIDKAHCLFHGPKWRAKFQHILNLVRKTIIPNKYMSRVGRAVCVCNPERNSAFDRAVDMDAKALLETLAQQSLTPELKASLETLPGGLKTLPSTDPYKSTFRLLLILHKALVDQDFSLLKKRKPASDSAPKEVEVMKMDFDLEFQDYNLGLLFGKKGRNIKRICEEFKAEIRYKPDSSVDGWRPTSTVKFTVTCPLQCQPDLVKAQLEKKAADIVRKQDVHSKRVIAWYKKKEQQARSRRERQQQQRSKHPRFDSWTLKENATEDFNKRSKHNKEKGFANKTKPPKVLEEGSRCLNCLTPYPKATKTSDKSSSDSDGDLEETPKDKKSKVPGGEKVCRFHPGYIAEKREWRYSLQWTCCQQEVSSREQSAQQESHKNTGCSTGFHNWRLTKKPSKRGPLKDSHTGIDAVNNSLKQMSVAGHEAISLATQLDYQ